MNNIDELTLAYSVLAGLALDRWHNSEHDNRSWESATSSWLIAEHATQHLTPRTATTAH